jgi:hypothetical protein
VYVILKKGEFQNNVNIQKRTTKVYFIRYGNQQQQAGGKQQQQRLQLSTGEQTSTGTFHGLDDFGGRGSSRGRIHRHQKLEQLSCNVIFTPTTQSTIVIRLRPHPRYGYYFYDCIVHSQTA